MAFPYGNASKRCSNASKRCRGNCKQWRPWSDCSSRSSLIWVCTVCPDLSVRKHRKVTVQPILEPSLQEKIETEEPQRSATPDRPKTPDLDLEKPAKPSPKRSHAPKPPQEVSLERQASKESSESPREGSVSSRSEGEVSIGKEEIVQAPEKERTPSPAKSKTPSPRSTPEKEKVQTSIRVSPIPMEPLPDLTETEVSEEVLKEVSWDWPSRCAYKMP